MLSGELLLELLYFLSSEIKLGIVTGVLFMYVYVSVCRHQPVYNFGCCGTCKPKVENAYR